MGSMSENRSSLKEFLASIATIKGDLSNITAPPFVLATQSAVEFPAYWAEHPSIFVAPASEPDAQKRALLVLKWFLSALKQQQYAGRDEKDGVKKPLNAFLGELFLAKWDDGTQLISEQVSHHPPVTACYLWNEEHGIRAEGYTCQEITFSGSVNIRQIGHAILRVDKYEEEYLIPLPNVKVKGILTGSPYPELNGTHFISSSNGFTSEIDFSGKGLFSGKKNSFQASLYHNDDKKNPLYTAEGQWNNQFTIHDVKNSTDLETYDVNSQQASTISVAELSQQDAWESRKAWAGVIDALNAGNMQAAVDEKSKVEEGQREMRKKEKADGTKWQQSFFTRAEEDPVFERLAAGTGEQLAADKTQGVWKFDHDRARQLKKPYHGELTPTG